MLKKDYIISQIEEFGKALSRIFSLRRDRKLDELEEEIKRVSSQFTNLELLWVEAMDDETFTRDIIAGEELERHRKRMLADLLFERMHYYLMANDLENSENVAWKCYRIYNEVFSKGNRDYDPIVQSKIEYLRSR